MKDNTEQLIYDMAFRVRLFIASKTSEQRVGDLTDRESLILELVGMQHHFDDHHQAVEGQKACRQKNTPGKPARDHGYAN